jgi:transposase
MQTKNNTLNFAGQDIFVGIDVHKKSWMVTILTEETEHKTFSMSPQSINLISYLKKNFPGGNYLCAYEAGFSGYWLQQELTDNGIRCMIVNPADVPQSDKDKRNKTDKVDSRRIAKALRNGQLRGIYIPKQEDIELRSLVRTRNMLVRNQTRCKNRIKSLLYMYGVVITEEQVQSYWSARYISKLEMTGLLGPASKASLMFLIEELKNIKILLGKLNLQLRELSKKQDYINNIELLKTVPGVGLITAMVLMTEIMDINRFRKYDHLVSYAGLMPMEHSSGETIIKARITPRCNNMLRHVIVESSWIASRKDPALMMAYSGFIKQGITKNRAIIKIARKLLCRIAHVLKTGESYSLAVVQ